MKVLDDLLYTKNHEWILIEDNIATVGITDYAQGELGDIVYVEIDTLEQLLEEGEVFGSVEAVKTVSDLFMPTSGQVISVNQKLENNPELVNDDPYGDGWIIKVQVDNKILDDDQLLSSDDYKELIGLS